MKKKKKIIPIGVEPMNKHQQICHLNNKIYLGNKICISASYKNEYRFRLFKIKKKKKKMKMKRTC